MHTQSSSKSLALQVNHSCKHRRWGHRDTVLTYLLCCHVEKGGAQCGQAQEAAGVTFQLHLNCLRTSYVGGQGWLSSLCLKVHNATKENICYPFTEGVPTGYLPHTSRLVMITFFLKTRKLRPKSIQQVCG